MKYFVVRIHSEFTINLKLNVFCNLPFSIASEMINCSGFKKYVQEYYKNTTNDDIRKGVDVIQMNLECCGYNG